MLFLYEVVFKLPSWVGMEECYCLSPCRVQSSVIADCFEIGTVRKIGKMSLEILSAFF